MKIPIKKMGFVSAAALAMASMSVGCISMPTIKKDNTFHGKQMAPAHGSVVVAADLEVVGKKVIGKAWGDYLNKVGVEQAAVSNAFARDPAGPNSADVLVAPSFFYEHDVDNGTITVTVVGYPARYKNFRPDPKRENGTALFMESVGGNSFISYPVQHDKGSVSGEKPAEQAPVNAQAQPVYPTPVSPAPAAYQAPAPVNVPHPAVQSVPAPVTEQTPVTNTPKE